MRLTGSLSTHSCHEHAATPEVLHDPPLLTIIDRGGSPVDEQALLKRLARYVKSIKERGGEWLGGTEFETEDGHHTDAMPGRSWWGLWLKWGPVAGFYRQTTHDREYFGLEAGGSTVWTGNMEGHGNWLDATYKELWLEAVQKMLERLDQVARPLGKTPEQVHDSGFNRAAEQVQQWLAEKAAGQAKDASSRPD